MNFTLFIHTIARAHAIVGRVSPARQEQVARKVREIFRFG